jgi:hypothetical protein
MISSVSISGLPRPSQSPAKQSTSANAGQTPLQTPQPTECSTDTEFQSDDVDEKPSIQHVIDLTNDDFLELPSHPISEELQRTQKALEKSQKEVVSARLKLEQERKLLENQKREFAHQQFITKLRQLEQDWHRTSEILKQRYGADSSVSQAVWARWIVPQNQFQFAKVMLLSELHGCSVETFTEFESLKAKFFEDRMATILALQSKATTRGGLETGDKNSIDLEKDLTSFDSHNISPS